MRFLVAFDGSPGAKRALEAGARLARAASAELEVLEVLNPLTDAADVVAPDTASAIARVVAEHRAQLETALSALDVAATGRVEQLQRGKDVPEHLARAAEKGGFDILVVSSRRAAGPKGMALGSVAQHLLRISPCPVLVVRP